MGDKTFGYLTAYLLSQWGSFFGQSSVIARLYGCQSHPTQLNLSSI